MDKSRDAAARGGHFGAMDHFEVFTEVKALLDAGGLITWEQWHSEGNTWTEEMLQMPGHTKDNYPIPSASEVSGALNRLKEINGDANFTMMSQVVAGAIKGVTTVLNDYWNGKTASFPFPSMAGSGDRMSLCWALFGKTPDLSLGVTPKTPGILYHACQGLNIDPLNPGNPNNCAAVEVFHTCKGSNSCKAEGGCGFVQTLAGGGSCGGSSCGAPAASAKPAGHGAAGCGAPGGKSGCGAPKAPKGVAGCGAPKVTNNTNTKADTLKSTSLANHGPLKSAGCGHPKSAAGAGCGQKNDKNLCGSPTPSDTIYGAPSDNKCASFGGCAVPISASQIFPSPDGKSSQGQMGLFNFAGGRQFASTPINTMTYNEGELVYDVAWNAYIAVLQERQMPIPAKPKPSDIRLAFPPST
jgi:hypothetical protein